MTNNNNNNNNDGENHLSKTNSALLDALRSDDSDVEMSDVDENTNVACVKSGDDGPGDGPPVLDSRCASSDDETESHHHVFFFLEVLVEKDGKGKFKL